jgi:hypothetical protein
MLIFGVPSDYSRTMQSSMGAKPQVTRGEVNQLLKVEVHVPRWLKNAAIVKAQRRGRALSDWLRDLIASHFTPEEEAAAIEMTKESET